MWDSDAFPIPHKGDPIFEKVNWSRLPKHVAIIMDGNGRWAKRRGLFRTAGHTAGVRTLKKILKVAIGLELEALTVYAFSTENWKRPQAEVDFLMKLFADYLDRETQEMFEDNVKIKFIGRIDELAPSLQHRIEHAEQLMKDNTGVKFNVAANYGGKDEIVRAVQKIIDSNLKTVDENIFETYLDTFEDPPVDLLIRTSGDKRLSNFLLWQTAYAEFYFAHEAFPEFTPENFVEAIIDFGTRERRFGSLKNTKGSEK